MNSDNPYASPNTTNEKPPSEEQPIKYQSRKQAIVAGLKKGAKFGGKLMAAISLMLAALGWLFYFGGVLYLWLWKGADFGYVCEKIELLKGIGETLVLVLYMTLLGALPGAIIMGIAAGIVYKPSAKNDGQEFGKSEPLMKLGNEE